MRWGLSWVTSSHTSTRMMRTVIPKIPSVSTKRLWSVCVRADVIRLDPQQHLPKIGITIPMWWVNKLTQRGKRLPERLWLSSQSHEPRYTPVCRCRTPTLCMILYCRVCVLILSYLKHFTCILIHSFDLTFPRRPYQFPNLKRVWGKKWK